MMYKTSKKIIIIQNSNLFLVTFCNILCNTFCMEKFRLINHKQSSINRSIRIEKSMLDKLETISSATGISINKIIIKSIEYSLENMAKK